MYYWLISRIHHSNVMFSVIRVYGITSFVLNRRFPRPSPYCHTTSYNDCTLWHCNFSECVWPNRILATFCPWLGHTHVRSTHTILSGCLESRGKGQGGRKIVEWSCVPGRESECSFCSRNTVRQAIQHRKKWRKARGRVLSDRQLSPGLTVPIAAASGGT